MLIVFYISGHGFGHATRSIELIGTMATLREDARFVVRTNAPRWLFEQSALPIEVQPFEPDVGVVQIGGLVSDEDATARRASNFYRDFDRRVDEEATLLRRIAADLVLADIPPLAFAAASRAGLPSVAVANFTWDWIYGDYSAFEDIAPDVIPTIRRAYACATRALRLPLHGGFESMASVTQDIPFIARRATRDRDETRRVLGIDGDTRLVLASFGGYPVTLPLETVSQSSTFKTITVGRHPPDGLTHQDIVAAADVVVSKPGYGIVSECVASGTPLLYTSRGHFVEYDVFVDQMPRVLRCRYIARDELLAGRWSDAIDALLQQPAPPERPRTDGAQVAGNEIVNLVNG
jgi:L-arabinokinase